MDKNLSVENDSIKEFFFNLESQNENDNIYDTGSANITANYPFQFVSSFDKCINSYKGIHFPLPTLPNFKYNETENHINQLKKCSEKLIRISKLENNWNENGAEKFSYKLIVKCYSILVGLQFLPEIFPVADGSIQFEYEKKDGSYLEFNIFEDEISEFLSYPNEKEIEKKVSIDKISEEVKSFYERSSK